MISVGSERPLGVVCDSWTRQFLSGASVPASTSVPRSRPRASSRKLAASTCPLTSIDPVKRPRAPVVGSKASASIEPSGRPVSANAPSSLVSEKPISRAPWLSTTCVLAAGVPSALSTVPSIAPVWSYRYTLTAAVSPSAAIAPEARPCAPLRRSMADTTNSPSVKFGKLTSPSGPAVNVCALNGKQDWRTSTRAPGMGVTASLPFTATAIVPSPTSRIVRSRRSPARTVPRNSLVRPVAASSAVSVNGPALTSGNTNSPRSLVTTVSSWMPCGTDVQLGSPLAPSVQNTLTALLLNFSCTLAGAGVAPSGR